MKTALVSVVIAAVIVLWFLFRFHRMLVTTWFLVRLWRFMTGEAHHGHPVTDRGWFRAGQRALTPTGHATSVAGICRGGRRRHTGPAACFR